MKFGLFSQKFIFSGDAAVNKYRRNFLKQGFFFISAPLLSSCGSDRSASDAAEELIPPFILGQPVDISVLVGDSATFQVVAEGSGTLAYQWKKNGVNISGANSASYTTLVLDISDSLAKYSVEVTNGGGAILSRDAVITVNQITVTADTTSITVDSTLITVDVT